MYENFVIKAKRTVYKWWCVVYKPVYKLVHHGYWPNEKDPYVKYPDPVQPATEDAHQRELAQAMAKQVVEANRNSQVNVDEILQSQQASQKPQPSQTTRETLSDLQADEIPANVDDDVLARANEIMARLNREAAEDEAKKQAEIEEAKAIAAEQQQLASIMKANERNIDEFIEEGRHLSQEQAKVSDSLTIE